MLLEAAAPHGWPKRLGLDGQRAPRLSLACLCLCCNFLQHCCKGVRRHALLHEQAVEAHHPAVIPVAGGYGGLHTAVDQDGRQVKLREAHNPLELWNVVGVSLQLQHAPGAPSIRCNASVLHGAAEWVTVTWSGLGRGAHACLPAGRAACLPAGTIQWGASERGGSFSGSGSAWR